jgi:hypothetical protein
MLRLGDSFSLETIFFVRFRTGFKVAFFRRLRLKNREKGVVAKLCFFFFFFFLVSFFKEVFMGAEICEKKKPSVVRFVHFSSFPVRSLLFSSEGIVHTGG